jgi:hypothetical protein
VLDYDPEMGETTSAPGSTRTKLSAEVDLAPWGELKSHALADRLFVVGAELSLLDVAVAIASDATAEVEAWMRAESLMRPSEEQMTSWDETSAMPFRCVIVAPFVLAQLHSQEA